MLHEEGAAPISQGWLSHDRKKWGKFQGLVEEKKIHVDAVGCGKEWRGKLISVSRRHKNKHVSECVCSICIYLDYKGTLDIWKSRDSPKLSFKGDYSRERTEAVLGFIGDGPIEM